MAAQATAQASARHVSIDELPRHGKQVVSRKQQRGAQLHNDGLLDRRERRAQGVGAMGQVLSAVAFLPLADGLPAHVVASRQFGLGQVLFLDPHHFRPLQAATDLIKSIGYNM